VEVVVKLRRKPRFGAFTAQQWLRWSSVVGIASAVFLSVCVNLLGSRFDHRWDFTMDRRYSLAPVTRETLAAQSEPVQINVLLSRSDPLATRLQQVLASYLTAASELSLRWVDPDRDPGEYLALQSELGMAPGVSKGGKAVNESVVVLSRGKYRSYVTLDDLLTVDPKTGDSELRFEQALTRGLRELADTSRPRVCITQGHRELSPADEGPSGLSELRNRLIREPIELKVIDLGAGRQPELRVCRLAIVAGPDVALSTWAQQQLVAFISSGGSLLVLSNTIPDDTGQVHSSGLNPLIASAGITIANEVVIEQDERQRLPDGFGETLFAQIQDHAATRALYRPDAARSLRVLVSLAPALVVRDPERSKALLTSSGNAIGVENVGAYLREPDATKQVPKQHVLAAAAQLDSAPSRPPRRLVVAPASIVENRALRLPALTGNRAFIDGVLSWLLARPVGVEIPSPERAMVQMNVSEAELVRLSRYVMLFMPISIAGLGLAVVIALRRRGRSQSRRS